MKIKVTVIDYGIGNLHSVMRALEHCGAEVMLTDSSEKILNASHVVLPGVGAFSNGMLGLKQRNLMDPIKEYCQSNRPFLGICLGMQMLLDYTEEFGVHHGLGLIPGKVASIPGIGADGSSHKIPHIGWNNLELPKQRTNWGHTILEGMTNDNDMYFVHSYMAVPEDSVRQLAVCNYNGIEIVAAIKKGCVYGCQFHPEKSGPNGLSLLKNFLNT